MYIFIVVLPTESRYHSSSTGSLSATHLPDSSFRKKSDEVKHFSSLSPPPPPHWSSRESSLPWPPFDALTGIFLPRLSPGSFSGPAALPTGRPLRFLPHAIPIVTPFISYPSPGSLRVSPFQVPPLRSLFPRLIFDLRPLIRQGNANPYPLSAHILERIQVPIVDTVAKTHWTPSEMAEVFLCLIKQRNLDCRSCFPTNARKLTTLPC